MAIAIDRTVARDIDAAGIRGRRVVKLTGDTLYPTGGYAIAAGDLKLGVIEYFPPVVLSNGSAVRIGVYDYSTGKLQLFVPNTGAEVANNTDLSAFNGRTEVIGKP